MSIPPSFLGTSGPLTPAGPIPNLEDYYGAVNDAPSSLFTPHLAPFNGYIAVLRAHGPDSTTPSLAGGYAWYTLDCTQINPLLTGQYGNITVAHSVAAPANTSLRIGTVIPIDSSRCLVSGQVLDTTGTTAPEFFVQVIQIDAGGTITAGAALKVTDFTKTGAYYTTAGAFPVPGGLAGIKDTSGLLGGTATGPSIRFGAQGTLVATDTVLLGMTVMQYTGDVAGTQSAVLYGRRINLSGTTATAAAATWTEIASVLGNTAAPPMIYPGAVASITLNKATFFTVSRPTRELRAITVEASTMTPGTWYTVWTLPTTGSDDPALNAELQAIKITDGKLGLTMTDALGSYFRAWTYTELGASTTTDLTSSFLPGPGVTSRTLATPNGGVFVAGDDGGQGVVAELRWDELDVASFTGTTSLEYTMWDGLAAVVVMGTRAVGLSPTWSFGSAYVVDPGVSITSFTLETLYVPLPDSTIVLSDGDTTGVGAFFKLLGDFTVAHINTGQDVTTADVKLVFNDYDDDGTLWIVNDVVGWWTTPEPDVPDLERGYSDGSYLDTGRYKARVFTITGTYIPAINNGHYIQRARDRLLRAVSTARRTGVVFIAKEADTTAPAPGSGDTYTMIPKYVTVVPSGQPLIATSSQSGQTEWAVSFRAPDPVKYSVAPAPTEDFAADPVTYAEFTADYTLYSDATATGNTYAEVGGAFDRVNLNNIGNYRTPCIITVTGPISSANPVSITNTTTGQTIQVTGDIAAGEVLEINTATRRVALDGEIDYRYLLAPDIDWIYIDPGVNTISANLSANPGASATLAFRHGWIG